MFSKTLVPFPEQSFCIPFIHSTYDSHVNIYTYTDFETWLTIAVISLVVVVNVILSSSSMLFISVPANCKI